MKTAITVDDFCSTGDACPPPTHLQWLDSPRILDIRDRHVLPTWEGSLPWTKVQGFELPSKASVQTELLVYPRLNPKPRTQNNPTPQKGLNI